MYHLSLPHTGELPTREGRALELYAALGRHIRRTGEGLFEVPSSIGTSAYEVQYGGLHESCTCKDFELNGHETSCKHLLMVGIAHADRRRRHTFECSGCAGRLPLRDGIVVGPGEAAFSLFQEGEIVCRPCSRLHGVR